MGSNFVKYAEVKSFYEEYDDFRYRTEGHILRELDSIDFAGKKTLEIGLGQGADSMQLINWGADYYGIDLTEEPVRRVKERFRLFEKNYSEVRVANAEHIPYGDNSFDIVYSHGVIHHSPRMAAIVTEPVSRLTGESVERINRHKYHLKREGIKYFRMKNFLHRSTDGPDNVYSSVWTDRSVRKLFAAFSSVSTNVHFLNERHLLGFQHLLPGGVKKEMARRYGWHLWIKATK